MRYSLQGRADAYEITKNLRYETSYENEERTCYCARFDIEDSLVVDGAIRLLV